MTRSRLTGPPTPTGATEGFRLTVMACAAGSAAHASAREQRVFFMVAFPLCLSWLRRRRECSGWHRCVRG